MIARLISLSFSSAHSFLTVLLISLLFLCFSLLFVILGNIGCKSEEPFKTIQQGIKKMGGALKELDTHLARTEECTVGGAWKAMKYLSLHDMQARVELRNRLGSLITDIM